MVAILAMSLAGVVCWALAQHLCDSCRRRSRLNGGGGGSWSSSRRLAVHLSLRAVARNMASLAASIARLAGRVKWPTVGSSAVARDVAKLATGIALHSLSLAITSKMVGSSALVASSRTSTARETASETAVPATGSSRATSHSWIGAVAGKMASQTAAIAASTSASTAQAKSRAVSLDVSQALAVIALLSLGGTGMRASVGLVAGLLAVVAEPLGRRAHLSVVAHVSALEACATR